MNTKHKPNYYIAFVFQQYFLIDKNYLIEYSNNGIDLENPTIGLRQMIEDSDKLCF